MNEMLLPCGEVARKVKGYEYYYVTRDGRVWSNYSKKFLKLSDWGEYLQVWLSFNGKGTLHYVHRLVAETYIPKQSDNVVVNHIDEVKTNNHVDNLEWVTQGENVNHGEAQERKAEGVRKKVYVYCHESGDLINEYDSVSIAAKELGLYQSQVSAVIDKPGRHRKGYEFSTAAR